MTDTAASKAATHRRAPRNAERLGSLKEAAAELFLDCGYQGVSVDMLIERAGGSRRNVYSHFGGKTGLFFEAISGRCAEMSCPLEQLAIVEADLPSALTMFGKRLLEMVLQPRTLALQRLMVAEGQHFPDLAQAIWNAGPAVATGKLAEWLQQRQRQGEIGPDRGAGELARQFVNLVVTGPQLRALIGLHPFEGRGRSSARHVKHCVDLFLHGVAAAPAANAPVAATPVAALSPPRR